MNRSDYVRCIVPGCKAMTPHSSDKCKNHRTKKCDVVGCEIRTGIQWPTCCHHRRTGSYAQAMPECEREAM